MTKTLRRTTLLGCIAWTMLAASCSSEDEPLPTLEGETIVDRDPKTGTVDFFAPGDGKKVLAPGGNAEQAALDWMEANKDALGIPNPKESFAPIGTTTDEEDQTVHVKLQQKAGGLDVWGIESMVHFDEDGAVAAFDGPYIPNLDTLAKQAPKIDEPTAFRTAEADVRLELPDAATVKPIEQQLVVYVDDDYGSAALARHVRMDVEADTFRTSAEAFVDAMTGQVLDSWVDTEMNEVTAEGLDGDRHRVFANGPYSDLPAATPYKLMRNEGESDDFGKDLGFLIPGNWIGPKNGKWRDFLASSLDGPWDKHAVSAMFNIRRTERFYQDTFKWKGPNGKGSLLFLGVHFALKDEWNAFAFWSPDGKQDTINFTDRAEGMESGVVALDVVGHEFTHLVTAYNSKLVYRRQPGAINEAVSDIFGAFVERFVKGRTKNSFLVAEETGKAIRDMRHPTRLGDGRLGLRPDNYGDLRVVPPGEKLGRKKNDNGFVHYNSSIVNNAWALQAEGGVHDSTKVVVSEPIGWDRSIKLWWKTQRHLLTRRATIHRLARVQSVLAQKSRGRFDVRGVGCSWMAVNALPKEWVGQKLRISCDGPAPDACAGQRDGAYCDLEQDHAIQCSNGHVVSNRACTAGSCSVSPDGQSASCFTAQ